jgi:hypothetical protein
VEKADEDTEDAVRFVLTASLVESGRVDEASAELEALIGTARLPAATAWTFHGSRAAARRLKSAATRVFVLRLLDFVESKYSVQADAHRYEQRANELRGLLSKVKASG